jgi:hypothetical protein
MMLIISLALLLWWCFAFSMLGSPVGWFIDTRRAAMENNLIKPVKTYLSTHSYQ